MQQLTMAGLCYLLLPEMDIFLAKDWHTRGSNLLIPIPCHDLEPPRKFQIYNFISRPEFIFGVEIK
jgi:hypothetical protein